MEKCHLEVGEIVQLNPEGNGMFGAHFMVVTELKEWGAQGYILAFPSPGHEDERPIAYLRPTWDRMEKTGGFAVWLPRAEAQGGSDE